MKLFYFILCGYCTFFLPLLSVSQPQQSADRIFASGDTCYYRGAYAESILYYHQALDLYIQALDSAKISKTFNDIGVSYKKMGEFDSAKAYFEQALTLDKLRKDSLRIVSRYFNLSGLYNDKGNYSVASQLINKALDMAKKNGYIKSQANLNNSLGYLYRNQDEFNQALTYYHQAKEAYLMLQDSARYSLVLNNIGNCFTKLEQWDSAFLYLSKALQVKRQISDVNSEAYTLHSLGSFYFEQGLFDSAEYYLKQAYRIREELSDSYGIAFTGNELGQLYLSMHKPQDAIDFLLEAREYAEAEQNYTILIENIDALHDYYLMVEDTVKAYQALNQWSVLKDTLYNQEKVKVLELQSAFELDRKEEERKLQEEKAQNQSRLAEKRLIILSIVSGAALVLVVLVVFVIQQRRKIKRLNENLKLVNRDMYHRKKNDYMRLLDEISATNVPISGEMKSRLLASAAVDESLYEEESDQVSLNDYLIERLEDMADAQGLEARGIELQPNVIRINISGQKAKAILLVLNELITNSVKHSFAEQRGNIHVTIFQEGGKLRVIYKDDGAPFVVKSRTDGGMGQQIISQLLKTLRTELTRDVKGSWNESTFSIGVS